MDKANRSHIVSIKMLADYPNTMPECTCDIPVGIELQWNPKNSSIADVVKQYEKAFDQYQDLWNVLGDVDANTWVLEPERPSFSITMRRIALGNHCSLQFNVDPNRPRAVPECNFMGSETTVTPLRDQFNKNLNKWNNQLTLRQNLESILSITFPSPKNTKKRRSFNGVWNMLFISIGKQCS